MKISRLLATLPLALALVALPACDKKEDKKANDKKADKKTTDEKADKAEPGADEEAEPAAEEPE